MDTALSSKPVPHRESIVLLAYNELKKKHYIIVKLAHGTKAQLIRIDPESGLLKWGQAAGRDTFQSEAEALAYVQDQGKSEVLAHGKAVLGYAVYGPVALLLLAEAVRVSAVLPGGHEIKTVTQSRWHRIALQQPELDPISQAATKAELDRGVEKSINFDLDGAHFYCETLDISQPFPSERPVHEPSWPFVWNKALSLPFRLAGLDGPNAVCPALLQGMAESRELKDFDGCRFSYCLISRKCRLHVGPRYKARGLNELADPGNEIECDQVVWKHSTATDKPLAWSRYTWRRGSVPLWWTVNIRNGGMGEAEIKIRTTNTFRGSRRYVRRLQRRYVPNPHLDPDGDASVDGSAHDASLQVPVVFFSLLRKGTPDKDRSEAKLAEAFDYLAGQLRSMHKLPVSYVALDWHQMDKELGSEALVEAFWTQLSALLPEQGFALGTMIKTGPDHTDSNSQELGSPAASGTKSTAIVEAAAAIASGNQGYSSAGKGWVARWFKQQRGVTRYNCADSLDRTNVGSFFGAVQVFVEQCRELDIAIAATSASAASMARQALLRRQAAAAAAAAATAAAATAGGTPTSSVAAGRPPLIAVQGGVTQDKRSGAGGSSSSGFLANLGKDLTRGLGSVVGGVSPRSPSGKDPASTSPRDLHRDLSRDLRSQSTPNIMALQQPGQQQLSQLRMQLTQPQQQQQQGQGPVQQQQDQLPPGWEAKYDAINKRVFYVDHNKRTTTWVKPQWNPPAQPAAGAALNGTSGDSRSSSNGQSTVNNGILEQQLVSVGGSSSSSGSGAAVASPHQPKRPGSSSSLSRKSINVDDGASGSDSESGADKERYEPLTPWCMLKSPKHVHVKHFARVINPAALSAIAELFLMNGDMCAWLYTGSPAMHSEKITMFEPESSRLKKAGAGSYSNSLIAIRRRYNNVLMDDERKMQAEIFLGLKTRLYFPTLHLGYREPEGDVPDDWPDSEEDEPGQNGECKDPLGLLTWPLESSKSSSRMSAANLAGAAAALVGLGGSSGRGGSAPRPDRAQLASGNSFSETPDLLVGRTASHTRSFSSEKILQDFRELQRQSQGLIAAAASGGKDSVLNPVGRPPCPVPLNPTSTAPASAAATAAVAAANFGSSSMADFDEELGDKAPPAANVLKPFEDPLGLL